MVDTTNYYVCNRCGKPCEALMPEPPDRDNPYQTRALRSECCQALVSVVSSKDKEP